MSMVHGVHNHLSHFMAAKIYHYYKKKKKKGAGEFEGWY